MAKHLARPVLKRKRGNPKWGKPLPRLPALLTEFELQVKRLGLTEGEYVASVELHRWCDRNRNRCYVPECLLKAWGMQVESIFSGVA
jgi:hypothetical protein